MNHATAAQALREIAADVAGDTEIGARLLCTLPRPGYKGAPDQEIRVKLMEWQGSKFLHMQIWTKDRDKWKPDPARIVTIRANELVTFAGAVALALDALQPTLVANAPDSWPSGLAEQGDTLPDGKVAGGGSAV